MTEVAGNPRDSLLDGPYLAGQASSLDGGSWPAPPEKNQDLSEWYSKVWPSRTIDPRCDFSVNYYLETQPDVRSSGIEPFRHFCSHGYKEGRRPHPLIFPRFAMGMHELDPSSAQDLLHQLSEPTWFNPLLRTKTLFADLHEEMQDPRADLSRYFVFDYDRWLSASQDVIENYPLHPVHHLFSKGLDESRLRSSGAIDWRLTFNGGGGPGDDLQAVQKLRSPVQTATFAQVSPQRHRPFDPHHGMCAIGIVYYNNTQREVQRMARSIAAQRDVDPSSIRVLVLDNSPHPKSGVEQAFSEQGIQCEIVEAEGNIGFGPGHNMLMQKAFASGTTHYLGLNPDGFLLHNSIAAVLTDSAANDDRALTELDSFPVGHPKWWDPRDGSTSWVSGAAFLCPRRVFEQTGGFDPDSPLYGEDVDWSLRCRTLGIPVKVSGRARFFHDITPRFGVEDSEREKNSLFGNWYLLTKWGATQRAAAIERRLRTLGVEQFPYVDVVEDVDPQISEDLTHARYAQSRFWR